MGRFGVNDADNYGSNGGNSFFSLKNDGDIARVRFMYNSMEDIEGYAVHEVEVDGKRRYVNCLRQYNEPKSNCPFCNANSPQRAKVYIPLYDEDEKEVKIWERGKNFFAKLGSICARYATADTPLVANVFEVERHGKKGDTNTTYETYQIEKDNTRLEDLPELPDILGGIVLDKSFAEAEYYVEHGEFPSSEATAHRGSSEERPVSRRTPSRNSEAF